MSATEVLYVARGVERNAPRAERLEHHCKGAILAVRPKGAWISPDAFDAWLRGGDEPEGLRTIEEHKADELRLWVRQARYYTGASFDPLRELARLKKPTTGAAVRGMQGKVQTYRNSIEKIERLGLDSNWGFADLATFGVMITEPIQIGRAHV